jgi:DNA-binding winged helix-turn-helix (wHTH) protein
MRTNISTDEARDGENISNHGADCRPDARSPAAKSSPIEPLGEMRPMRGDRSDAAAGAALEFGCFRVMLRRRQLVADSVPIRLGTRALDLLLVLLEANGALVTKSELLNRVWPGSLVAEENLRVQMFALRRALGADRDFIHTEYGRGYRFTAAIRQITAGSALQSLMRPEDQPSRRLVPQWISRDTGTVSKSRGRFGGPVRKLTLARNAAPVRS